MCGGKGWACSLPEKDTSGRGAKYLQAFLKQAAGAPEPLLRSRVAGQSVPDDDTEVGGVVRLKQVGQFVDDDVLAGYGEVEMNGKYVKMRKASPRGRPPVRRKLLKVSGSGGETRTPDLGVMNPT